MQLQRHKVDIKRFADSVPCFVIVLYNILIDTPSYFTIHP